MADNNNGLKIVTEMFKDASKTFDQLEAFKNQSGNIIHNLHKQSEREKQDKAAKIKTYWNQQNEIDASARVRAYPKRFFDFKRKFKSANEIDFLQEEIKQNQDVVKAIDLTDDVQKSVGFHIKRYIQFLEENLNQLELEEKFKSDTELEKNMAPIRKLSFTTTRRELTLLMLLLKDAGIIQMSSDNQLAKFMEAHFNYSLDVEMKSVINEISKIRNLEINREAVQNLVGILSKTEIQVKDDLK